MVNYRFIACNTLLVLVLNLFSLQAQTDQPMLTLRGEFVNDGHTLEGVVIKIIMDSTNIETLVANKSGRFKTFLDYKKNYEIEFSKKGFITQTIEFSTKLPNAVYKRDGSSFYIDEEFEMYHYYPGMDVSLFEDYFIRFKWNDDMYHFVADEKYNKKIKKEEKLASLKKEQEKQKQLLYTKQIHKADSFFKSEYLEESGYYYTMASELKKKDKYTSSKIKEVKKLMKQKGILENGYETAIEKANNYLDQKKLDEAKTAYKIAIFYKPDETFPQNRIADIDSIVSYNYLQLINSYEAAIEQGNTYYKLKDYKNAEKEYLNAQTLIPERKKHLEKLKLTQEKIKEETLLQESALEDQKKEVDFLYKKIIAKADSFFDAGHLQNALTEYQKAQQIAPSDKTINDKVKAINEQLNLNKQYQLEIEEGDRLLADKDWGNALLVFRKAQQLKPNEKYPIQKIEWLENQITKEKQAFQAEQVQIVKAEQTKPAAQNKPPAKPQDIETVSTLNEKTKEKKLTEIAPVEKKKVPEEQFQSDSLLLAYTKTLKTSRANGDREKEAQALEFIASIYHSQQQLNNALNYYQQAITILENESDSSALSSTLGEMAVVQIDSGLYNQSIETYKNAIEIKLNTGDSLGASEFLTDMGIIYETMFDSDNALEVYTQSLKIKQNLNDLEGTSDLMNNIADVYFQQNNMEQSVEFYKKSLDITQAIDDQDKSGTIMNDIGVALYELGKYNEAIDYYKNAMAIKENTDSKKELSMTMNNIGNVNFSWKNFNNAISYYERSIAIKKEIDYHGGIAISLFNIANAYEKLNKLDVALEFYIKSEEEAKNTKVDKQVMANIAKCISRVFQKKEAYKEAFLYQSQYLSYGIFPNDVKEVISERYDRNAELKAQKEITFLKRKIQRQKILAQREAIENQKALQIKNLQLQNKETVLKRQKILFFFLGFIILSSVIFVFVLFKLFNNKKKANSQLSKKNKLILEQSKHINDSITYASKIQSAAMPQKELLDRLLGKYFVYYRPLNIVSGDFYWLAQHESNTILAVADCTGHGVPGAMLCMLGISFLDEAVKEKSIVETEEILNTMRAQVIELLHQREGISQLNDGIDMALCKFDIDNRQVQFSGANNPLYIIRNGELTEYKADRMPVSHSYKNNQFTKQTINLLPGDMLYMFSDGYMDQLGGPRNTRMMRKRFKEALLEIHSKPMQEQQDILDKKLNDWMQASNTDQIDDILVLGMLIE